MAVTPNQVRENAIPPELIKPARVFVSYKRNAEPDEPMADEVVSALEQAGHEVFIDRHMLVGVPWAEEIERQIRRSDFLIVLLTAASCRSEGLLGEIDKARKYQAQTGRPRILPVRLAFLGELPYPINGWLNGTQYALWRGAEKTSELIQELIAAIQGSRQLPQTDYHGTDEQDSAPSYLAPLPIPGGAMPPDDPLWVPRPVDRRAMRLVAQWGQTVVLKAPRQMGKTSLLYRMAQEADRQGKDVVFADLQLFGRELFQQSTNFYHHFAATIAGQSDAISPELGSWDTRSSQPTVCTQFMEKHVLEKARRPVVLAVDEADLLISSPFREDFFGMLRAWHGLRANPLKKIWKKLDLYLVTSTEPAFLIQGTQSPFNVSPPLVLEKLGPEHVDWLNEQHGSPFRATELNRLMELTAGHPYLTRLALYEVSALGGATTPDQFFVSSADEAGPFGSHLRRFLLYLFDMPEVLVAFRDILHGRGCENPKLNYRLEAAGLVTIRNGKPSPGCGLYREYFRERLG